MKLAASFLALVAFLGRSDGCYISREFGSGTTLNTQNVDDFRVAAGATSTCTVSCNSGSVSFLYMKYGETASSSNNDGSANDSDGCGMAATIDSPTEQIRLGWTIEAQTYDNLKIVCSCSKPAILDGGGMCFSSRATVLTRSRGVVAMEDLQVGDSVFVGKSTTGSDGRPAKAKYETVYGFGHYHETKEQEFLQVHTDSTPRSSPLELTGNHMVHIAGKHQPARADAVRVGDLLVHEHPNNVGGTADVSSATRVTKIGSVTRRGLYMPLTPSGVLVVNGLRASSYVSLKEETPAVVRTAATAFGLTEENILHWWLSPHRMLCLGVSSNFCGSKNNPSNFDSNEEGILNWLYLGKSVAEYADQQNGFVQVFFIGLPLVVIFGGMVLWEGMVGPSLAPTLALMAVAAVAYFVTTNKMKGAGLKKVA